MYTAAIFAPGCSNLKCMDIRKYKLFPEICEKMSKSYVLPQNNARINTKWQNYPLYGWVR